MGGKLPPYAVAESDGSPTVYQPWKIIFPNGTITDVGDGTVYVGIGTSISTTTSITVSTYDTRTPIIAAGTVLYFLTDGNVANFLNGAGIFSVPSSIAYAPSNATYIVQTNDAILSSEQVMAALSTGLIKNTAVTGVFSIASGGVDFENILVAGSPILKSFSTISIVTDGVATNFLNGKGLYSVPSGLNIVYAPSGATYIVQTNDTVLSNEQILASLATGLLKNTGTTGILTIASGGVDFENILIATSPLLKNFSTLSIQTDGTTTNYFRGDGTYAIPASNSGIKIATFTITSSSTWTADTIPVFQAPYETPITIKQVNVTSSGSSPLLGFNLQMRPWGTLVNVGSNIFSALQSAPTTGIEITSAISSETVLAKAHVLFASSAIISGQADFVTGVIYYSRNSI